MLKVQKSGVPTEKSDRRRGRPAGKNRKPLSLEERRARNAQYERERRNETADAMAQLAEAACCDVQISNAELLATVISQLQRRAKRKLPKDIEELKRANEDLESQIADLQSRLGPDDDFDEDSKYDCFPDQQSDSSSNSDAEEPQTQEGSGSQSLETKESLSNFQSTTGEVKRSRKIRKTSNSSSVSGAYDYDSDAQTDSDSDSDWSNTQTLSKQYQLRQRRQKVSEQSENTTYRIPHESETSENVIQVKKEIKFEYSDQSDVDSTNVKNETLSTIPEQDEYGEHYDDMTDTTMLDKLTEDDKLLVKEWLDSSETLNAIMDQDNNKVKTFLDFDNFLLDINA